MDNREFKRVALDILDKAEFINSNSHKMEVNVSVSMTKSFRQDNIFDISIRLNGDFKYLTKKKSSKEEVEDVIKELDKCIDIINNGENN